MFIIVFVCKSVLLVSIYGRIFYKEILESLFYNSIPNFYSWVSFIYSIFFHIFSSNGTYS